MLLIGTHINKIDKKGRISVPKPYRASLAKEAFSGVYVYHSDKYPCLEAFGSTYLWRLAKHMDDMDLSSERMGDLRVITAGSIVELPYDTEGRVTLPRSLMEQAELRDSALFCGLFNHMQIWNPAIFERYRQDARSRLHEDRVTAPQVPTSEDDR